MRYLVLAASGLVLLTQMVVNPSPRHDAPLKLAVLHSLKYESDVRLISERSPYMRSER